MVALLLVPPLSMPTTTHPLSVSISVPPYGAACFRWQGNRKRGLGR
jgi:hypothetical protein